MEFKNKIAKRFKEFAHRTCQKAAPIVQKELKKTVDKGKEDIICSVLDGVEILVMSAIMLSVVLKPSDILGSQDTTDARNFYMVYNEVHVTNNYYKEAV